MGILDLFKKSKKEKAAEKVPMKQTKPVVRVKASKEKKEKKELLKPGKKDTKNAYKIFLKPLVTEKATASNTYLFAVDKKTNKQEVSKAIKAVYGVQPRKVNIMNFGGKKVRWGKSSGSTRAWKKAVVYLKAGEKIEVFES